MNFFDLGLSDEVLKAVDEAGYKEPTPIQRQAIPVVLQGRDVLGIAQTGTGKTASFTLPMIDILASGRARARMPRSLIVEPTRELAAQVAENFQTYGKYHKLSMALLIGGTSFSDQERALEKGADVLIATPGRLLDHADRGGVLLNGVEILVIDEADRMLDMGFIPDIERIMDLMKQRHQTLFFSATMPPEIKRLTDRFLNDPKAIQVSRPATAAHTVEQKLVPVRGQDREKRAKLRSLIRAEALKNAIIFCNRKRDVQVVYKSLKAHGFNAGQLHGDMDQSTRTDTLQRFKSGDLQLLVASDVAARGLDIPDVSHVFNFDVPIHADDYVHRIGRTGRAGREGKAFTLATAEDHKFVAAIEKLMGQEIPRLEGEDASVLDEAPADDRKRRDDRRRGKDKDRGKAKGSDKDGSKDRKAEAKGGRPARDHAKTDSAPAQKAQEKAQEQKSQDKRDRGRDDRRRDREDSTPVVGLGDHVPAFLMVSFGTAKRDEGAELTDKPVSSERFLAEAAEAEEVAEVPAEQAEPEASAPAKPPVKTRAARPRKSAKDSAEAPAEVEAPAETAAAPADEAPAEVEVAAKATVLAEAEAPAKAAAPVDVQVAAEGEAPAQAAAPAEVEPETASEAAADAVAEAAEEKPAAKPKRTTTRKPAARKTAAKAPAAAEVETPEAPAEAEEAAPVAADPVEAEEKPAPAKPAAKKTTKTAASKTATAKSAKTAAAKAATTKAKATKATAAKKASEDEGAEDESAAPAKPKRTAAKKHAARKTTAKTTTAKTTKAAKTAKAADTGEAPADAEAPATAESESAEAPAKPKATRSRKKTAKESDGSDAAA